MGSSSEEEDPKIMDLNGDSSDDEQQSQSRAQPRPQLQLVCGVDGEVRSGMLLRVLVAHGDTSWPNAREARELNPTIKLAACFNWLFLPSQ